LDRAAFGENSEIASRSASEETAAILSLVLRLAMVRRSGDFRSISPQWSSSRLATAIAVPQSSRLATAIAVPQQIHSAGHRVMKLGTQEPPRRI
jgi:hypothetical protein